MLSLFIRVILQLSLVIHVILQLSFVIRVILVLSLVIRVILVLSLVILVLSLVIRVILVISLYYLHIPMFSVLYLCYLLYPYFVLNLKSRGACAGLGLYSIGLQPVPYCSAGAAGRHPALPARPRVVPCNEFVLQHF